MPRSQQEPFEDLESGTPSVKAAFGAKNRTRLISSYFDIVGEPSVEDAWQHVYRLLLWIDGTTGLPHCYESDKAQPGLAWHERSLRFHDWLSTQLDVHPKDLGERLDWLFQHAVEDLIVGLEALAVRRAARAASQREGYDSRGFPEPGKDPKLEDIIVGVLQPLLKRSPSADEVRRLTRDIRSHVGLENKRKNLLGEGFEDVLKALVDRLNLPANPEVLTRHPLQDLPGFGSAMGGEKERKVDVALISANRRDLVSAKWSVRADREEQFRADYDSYRRLESTGNPFRYYCLTNEFDPARLARACEAMVDGQHLFDAVTHINPSGLLAAYDNPLTDPQLKIAAFLDSGRLISLTDWLFEVGR